MACFSDALILLSLTKETADELGGLLWTCNFARACGLAVSRRADVQYGFCCPSQGKQSSGQVTIMSFLNEPFLPLSQAQSLSSPSTVAMEIC